MFCHEFLQNQSLYLDDALAPPMRAACDEHLRGCPLCRAELSEMQALTNQLSNLKSATALPFDLADSVRRSVAIELAAQQTINQPRSEISRWQLTWTKYLRPQMIPVATGIFTSLLLFAMMFASLIQSMAAFREIEAQSRRERAERELLLAKVSNLPYEQLSSFPAADYAVRRLDITTESPSLNPQSAFIALTSSLTRGESKNEAIMVVVDVLSDGFANIADVIQSPGESNKLIELDKLLSEDPAFVSAALDRRPDNVRVVFLIQKVDVRESDEPANIKVKNSKIF